MSKKVYDVTMLFDNTEVDDIDFEDHKVIKTFASEELAKEYMEKNFVRLMNEMDEFHDLIIEEKVVEDKVEEVATKVTPASCFWLTADLNKDFKVLHLHNCFKTNEEKDNYLKENVFRDRMNENNYIAFLRMSMNEIKTRKQVVDYIEKRVSDLVK